MDVIKLKEMLSSGKISLGELSESELYAVIEYESARIDDEGFDSAFLDECFAEMAKFCDSENIITENELCSIAKTAMRTSPSVKTRSRPKKLWTIIIAIALLVAALTTTSVAFGNNPISEFFSNIQELLNIKPGDVVTSGNNDISILTDKVDYNTIGEAESAMGVTLILPTDRASCHFTQIYSYRQAPDFEPVITLSYTYKSHRISQTVYLGSSYEQEKNFIEHKDEMEHVVIDGKTYYFAESKSYFSIFMFSDGIYYNISVDSREAAMELLGIS